MKKFFSSIRVLILCGFTYFFDSKNSVLISLLARLFFFVFFFWESLIKLDFSGVQILISHREFFLEIREKRTTINELFKDFYVNVDHQFAQDSIALKIQNKLFLEVRYPILSQFESWIQIYFTNCLKHLLILSPSPWNLHNNSTLLIFFFSFSMSLSPTSDPEIWVNADSGWCSAVPDSVTVFAI